MSFAFCVRPACHPNLQGVVPTRAAGTATAGKTRGTSLPGSGCLDLIEARGSLCYSMIGCLEVILCRCLSMFGRASKNGCLMQRFHRFVNKRGMPITWWVSVVSRRGDCRVAKFAKLWKRSISLCFGRMSPLRHVVLLWRFGNSTYLLTLFDPDISAI